jgi:hypothetical protein
MTEEEVIEQVAKALYRGDWGKASAITKVSYKRKAKGVLTTACAIQNIMNVFPEATIISSN